MEETAASYQRRVPIAVDAYDFISAPEIVKSTRSAF
jgi:hypothetical protein